ncbi:hypothetical protein QTP88_017777 [Uroleucon formosanum]
MKRVNTKCKMSNDQQTKQIIKLYISEIKFPYIIYGYHRIKYRLLVITNNLLLLTITRYGRSNGLDTKQSLKTVQNKESTFHAPIGLFNRPHLMKLLSILSAINSYHGAEIMSGCRPNYCRVNICRLKYGSANILVQSIIFRPKYGSADLFSAILRAPTQTVSQIQASVSHCGIDKNVEIVLLGEGTSEAASSSNMILRTTQIARAPKRCQLSLHTYVPKKISEFVLLECVAFEESHTSHNLSQNRILGHFKRSSNASHELNKYQQNSGTVPKKKIQDIATHQWKLCKELCMVLKPFEEVSKIVSGENYMSASLVIILYDGLKDVNEKICDKDFEIYTTQVIIELKNGLLKRFSNLEKSNTLTMCTFLDLRFKLFPLSENIANQTKIKIINATIQIAKDKTEKPQDQIVTITNNTQVESDEFCIWNSFDTTASKITPQGSNTSKGIIEVNRYMDENLLLRTGDPSKWWKEYGYNYPNLIFTMWQCGMFLESLSNRPTVTASLYLLHYYGDKHNQGYYNKVVVTTKVKEYKVKTTYTRLVVNSDGKNSDGVTNMHIVVMHFIFLSVTSHHEFCSSVAVTNRGNSPKFTSLQDFIPEQEAQFNRNITKKKKINEQMLHLIQRTWKIYNEKKTNEHLNKSVGMRPSISKTKPGSKRAAEKTSEKKQIKMNASYRNNISERLRSKDFDVEVFNSLTFRQGDGVVTIKKPFEEKRKELWVISHYKVTNIENVPVKDKWKFSKATVRLYTSD